MILFDIIGICFARHRHTQMLLSMGHIIASRTWHIFLAIILARELLEIVWRKMHVTICANFFYSPPDQEKGYVLDYLQVGAY